MMKTNICFTFQVHQPFRLRNFHFFDIGTHHNYFDEETNSRLMLHIARNSYLPTNQLLLKLIKTKGSRIKVSFAISGNALDQMEQYAPEVLESFKELAATGNVEFICQTYSSSLSSLKSKKAFFDEVSAHKRQIFRCFRMRPKIFLNTGLLYSDNIGEMVAHMGYNGMIIEGSSTVLNGKSPNHLYENPTHPALKLFLRNGSLNDDIAFRFSDRNWSEWPLTSEKYMAWLNQLPDSAELVNLVMDYGTFGEHHKKESGIFDFLEYLFLNLAASKKLRLTTPTEVLKILSPKAKLKVATPISWEGSENPTAAWLDNEMQQEAFDTLYSFENQLTDIPNKNLHKDWERLKSGDHYLYMKQQENGMGNLFNPYDNSYDSFLKYMNVLSDFQLKVANINREKPKKRHARQKVTL